MSVQKQKNKIMYLKTYEKRFNACVVPILNYHSSDWGYKDYSSIDSEQNRSLGVHRFAPKLAINGDVGWFLQRKDVGTI